MAAYVLSSSLSLPSDNTIEYKRKKTTNSSIQNDTARTGDVVIVGGGPAGCLMAMYCAKRGFHVHLFEKRSASFTTGEQYVGSDSRSYTMLLTCRAIQALENAQVKLPSSLMGPLVGACVHLPNGKTRAFNYSSNVSYGVSRNGFVGHLQENLLKRFSDDVSTYFGWELVNIDVNKSIAVFQPVAKYNDHAAELENMEVKYDLLIGADGVSSKTRSEMLKISQLDSESPSITMEFTRNPESYKSFYVRPTLAKASPLYKYHDHVQSWPALNMLLVGMANGSFWGGSKNAELLNASTASEIDHIFRKKAPEVYDLLLQQNPNFAQDYLQRPAISFGGAVILSRFHHHNIVLIGDAAHVMFPSYGTGCNVALEDCLVLDRIMEEVEQNEGKMDCRKVAEEFTRRRLEDAHAIVEMNTDLRLFPRGILGILQTAILTTLHKVFPNLIGPTAYQLLWSHEPFKKIKKKKQIDDAFFLGVIVMLVAAAIAMVRAILFKK